MSGRNELITSANLYGVWQSPKLGIGNALVWWPEGLSPRRWAVFAQHSMIYDGMRHSFWLVTIVMGGPLSPLPWIHHVEYPSHNTQLYIIHTECRYWPYKTYAWLPTAVISTLSYSSPNTQIRQRPNRRFC